MKSHYLDNDSISDPHCPSNLQSSRSVHNIPSWQRPGNRMPDVDGGTFDDYLDRITHANEPMKEEDQCAV